MSYAADKQTDKQKTPNALPTLTDIVGVDNYMQRDVEVLYKIGKLSVSS